VKNTNQQPLKIYPNPSIDRVRIDLPNTNENLLKISIHNLQGLIVFARNGSQKEIDISHVAQGTFMIQARTSRNIYTGKLLKTE